MIAEAGTGIEAAAKREKAETEAPMTQEIEVVV